MKTKVDSPLSSREISFKFNDKASTKKNKDFRKTMESYNKDNVEKSDLKEKNTTKKLKTNEKPKKDKKVQTNEVDKMVDENKNSDKELENQIHLEFLFNESNKSYDNLEIEKKIESQLSTELNLNPEIKERLNLSEKDLMLLQKYAKEIHGENKTETLQPIEKGNSERVSVNVENSKNDLITKTDENSKAVSDKSFKLLDITTSNEGKQSEEMEKNSLEKVDSTNISIQTDETKKNDRNFKKVNIESEELNTVKSETDLKDESFLVHKKEVSFNKNINIETNKPEPVDVKKTIQQISEHMKFSINNNKNQIKISLKPETLGEMAMEIEVIEGSLTAKVMVDNQKTKEIIQNNLFQLKDEIKDTGLEIKSFEVFVGNGNDFSKNGSRQFNFNKFNKKNHNNLRIKKASNENEGTGYNDPIIDGINNSSNIYEKGSLNLLA
jgi:flagellar hook-length control protein FliK